MNSRQRRGVILLILSILCALGAFAGVLSVISDAKSKVGPEVTAYQLKRDVEPYTTLSADQFERIEMPRRWLSDTAVERLTEINGKIAVTKLAKGSLLQRDMIVARPELQSGEQEIAIMIDAATGVAGKIRPGNAVNIYATFAGNERQDAKATSVSRIIVTGARVIDVGRLTSLEKPKSGAARTTAREAVPITFALDTLDAQRVAYAESFAENVRLALLAPDSANAIGDKERSYRLESDS
ncbi:Flp pilus assembly protein CpaB [Streptomyces sp. NPDC060194]|uniref:Flp pilus assembly protein CpaB n=1 Tax=Streptomyces sp. NPDC060194 TaxID=3347069 RepID=UPI00364D0841